MVMFASQLPVASCCCCHCCWYTLCLLVHPVPAAACQTLQTIGILSLSLLPAQLPLHLHEQPQLLSLFRHTLPLSLPLPLLLLLSLSRICCCLIARKRQRNKKSNFPCGLIRFGVAISRCVIAKWLQLPVPGHRIGSSSSSRTWPALAKNSNFQSGAGDVKKKRPKRTKILI